jgi:hypothetical protein
MLQTPHCWHHSAKCAMTCCGVLCCAVVAVKHAMMAAGPDHIIQAYRHVSAVGLWSMHPHPGI